MTNRQKRRERERQKGEREGDHWPAQLGEHSPTKPAIRV